MMKKTTFLTLLSALIIATVICDDGSYVPPQPPVPPQPTTSRPPKPTTSTDHPSTKTTTIPTTTPVPTHPSTSKTPVTTTSKSTTTTTSKTTTTTTAPTTPPPPQPTTPIPNPPKNPPKPGSWSVNFTNSAELKNRTCLLTKMAIQVEIPYNVSKNATKTAYVDIPPEANVTGSCKEDSDVMTLTWGNGNNTKDSATFVFKKVNHTFTLSSIEFTIVADKTNFPGYNTSNNSSVISLQHVNSEFPTNLQKSYKCTKEQTLNLTSADNKTIIGHLHISHVQLQAFHNATGKSFAEAEDCEPFDTPDVVPIAVGCALAALVIIVLIAYLIGRRRSQARGYLSM